MAFKGLSPLAVIALMVVGALAPVRPASADLPGGEAGLVLSPNVVVSGGTFLATITAEEDDPQADNIFFNGSDTEIASMTEESCTTGAGPCLVGPTDCSVPPEICLEWDTAALDADGAPGPVTIEVLVEASCDAGRTFINPTAEQGATFDQDSVLCYPLDAPLFTIEKSFDGDEDDSFDFLIETDGAGCYVSIGGGAPFFVADSTTFSITPGEAAGVYCGTFETTITELPADDAEFESLTCTDDVPGLDVFQISGASVTVSFLDNFFHVFCTFENEDEDGEDPDCPCGNEIDLDIDNTNNNDIGIDNDNTNNNANNNANSNANANDNENKNNNENTNEQNQTNNQEQSNANDQTNNIHSSPEVNISGSLNKAAPLTSTGGASITPPSTGDAGLAGGATTMAWRGLSVVVLLSAAGVVAARRAR